MADTNRQKILGFIETSLLSLTSVIKTVEKNRANPVDIDTTPMPSAFIYSGRESRHEGREAVIGYENWEWDIHIEVWARDTDMEVLLQTIHNTIFSLNKDSDFRVVCEEIKRTSADVYTVDPDNSLQALLIDFWTFYRHKIGEM
jgi:hypothetical protein